MGLDENVAVIDFTRCHFSTLLKFKVWTCRFGLISRILCRNRFGFLKRPGEGLHQQIKDDTEPVESRDAGGFERVSPFGLARAKREDRECDYELVM
jgi:hypothetical protein